MMKVRGWVLVSSFFLALLLGGSARGALEGELSDFPKETFSAGVDALPRASDLPEAIDAPCLTTSGEDVMRSNAALRRISIAVPNSRKWETNVLSALLDSSPNIADKYKNDFPAVVTTVFEDDSECSYFADVRLSGDWKDHIRIEGSRVVSSLNISLKNGNVNGFVDFKLLLEETRNGSSEILATEVFRRVGILSPRTQRVLVTINGVTVSMLMQENLTKEMLESQNIRESVMLEIDESLLWRERAAGREQSTTHELAFPRVLNSKWSTLGPVQAEITWNAFLSLSRALAVDNLSADGLNDALLSGGNEVARQSLARFRLLSLAMRAEHGLIHNNRRFYFDPLQRGLFPVYYDGEPKFSDGVPSLDHHSALSEGEVRQQLRGVRIADVDQLRLAVQAIDVPTLFSDLQVRGVFPRLTDLERLIETVNKNLIRFLDLISPQPQPDWVASKYRNESVEMMLVFGSPDLGFESCDVRFEICDHLVLSDEQQRDLLRARLVIEGLQHVYSGPTRRSYELGDVPEPRAAPVSFSNRVDGAEIITFGRVDLEIDRKRSSLTAELSTAEDRLVIRGGSLSGWDINVEGPTDLERDGSVRFDENQLTGCLTFMDTLLEEIDVRVRGGSCEDSVNFIRSTGEIGELLVLESEQDAVDLDFSKLRVRRLSVENAGNDCLDLSAGTYLVEKMFANSCADKAVSVGEGAEVWIGHLSVEGAAVGAVAKDPSSLVIDFAKITNVNFCASAYRKKQEFGGAAIKFEKVFCPAGRFVAQSGSDLDVPN